MPAPMPEASHPASLWLQPMLFIYGSCMLLFLLDNHLLPRIFVGYGAIESEYRPLEQATRFGYLLLVAVAFIHLKQFPDHGRETRTTQVVLGLGVLMVFLENNWDLWLREPLLGRVLLSVLLTGSLLYLFIRFQPRDWRAAALVVTVVLLLAVGQLMDSLHDTQKRHDPLVLPISTGDLSFLDGLYWIEEIAELLTAMVLLHAFARWLAASSGPVLALEFWKTGQGYRLAAGLLLLAAGNGFTVYDHGHFAPWKFFITGLVLMSTGAWMVNQAGKSDEYVSMKAAFLTEK